MVKALNGMLRHFALYSMKEAGRTISWKTPQHAHNPCAVVPIPQLCDPQTIYLASSALFPMHKMCAHLRSLWGLNEIVFAK